MILIGLYVLHNKKIVHRDLKPENIFIDEYPNKKRVIKIGDFGVSKCDLEKFKSLTTDPKTTVAYRSPELITSGIATDKDDIWALGIILYELLMLKRPFEKDYYVQY
jgi:serine/threonine protein kinase